MFINHTKVVIRSLQKSGFYSFAKVMGLTIGLVVSILIWFYVDYELKYDEHNVNIDRIFRVCYDIHSLETNDREQQAWVSALAGPQLIADYPQISTATRVKNTGGTIIRGSENYEESKLFFVDSTFFDVFTNKFIVGNPKTALSDPYSIVLTESLADKYFGKQWATKDLSIEPLEYVLRDTLTLKITGVIEDHPKQSHFSFDGLISHSTREILYDHINGWFSLGTHTYILSSAPTKSEILDELIGSTVMNYYGDEAKKLGYEIHLFTQPLSEIHLESNLLREIEANGNLEEVIILAIAGMLILIIACINFVNLSTAQDAQFTKQVGVRKVVGASRTSLIQLFMLNSSVIVFISFILSMSCIELLMSIFNEYFNIHALRPIDRPLDFWLTVTALFVLISLLGGAYSSIVLTKRKPAISLKGSTEYKHKFGIRKALIVLQFIAATVMICGSIIISRQVDFMMSKPLGYDKENTLVIDAWRNRELRQDGSSFKNEIIKIPGVKSATYSNSIPGEGLLQRSTRPEGIEQWIVMQTLITDYDFLSQYEVELISGRSFSNEIAADLNEAFIINESAAKVFDWEPENALGKKIEWGSKQGNIIGVVQDFHYQSIHENIAPLIIHMSESNGFISIKLSHTTTEVVELIQKKHEQMYPGQAFNFSFLDDRIQAKYNDQQMLGNTILMFTVIALLITCVGLISLIALLIHQKRKEIGIRKVLGATAHQIVILLTGSFTKMVIISSLLAVPLIYKVSMWWLSQFAYRIHLGIEVYIISASILIVICWATISYQSIKTALLNPVDSIKEE